VHCAVWTRKTPAHDRTKNELKKDPAGSRERWHCEFLLLAALISFSLTGLIQMQPDMDATSRTISNDLPFKFPGRNTDAFPNPWPNRDLAGKRARDKTPDRNTKEWNAILDFKESKDWQTGDLQKFANYFGVHHSSLGKKIRASLDERRCAALQILCDVAELQPQGATATGPSPPPLAAGGLCGRRMTPPKPGALAAAGGMRRADGAPGPPGGSPVPGREAAVGTKRHADGSVADGACAGAPTPRAPGARRRTDSTASAPPRPRGTAALRRLHAT